MRQVLLYIAALGLLLIPQAVRAVPPLVVGVLEEPQCKPEVAIAIRPLFVKSKGQWESLETRESAQSMRFGNLRWVATLDGNQLAQLSASDPGFSSKYAWTYSRDYLLKPVMPIGLDLPDNQKSSYAGWCDPPKHRPLVVTTGSRWDDPEGWKRIGKSTLVLQQAFTALRHEWSGKSWCMNGLDNKKTPVRIGLAQMKLHAAYHDHEKRVLVAVSLDSRLYECDSEIDEGGVVYWVLLGASPRYIGNMNDLVDAADYDGDGKTEFLFWYGGYNQDGYLLFSNDFRRKTSFLWSYH